MKAKHTKQDVQEATALIADFSNEELGKRVSAARSLPFIAEILGPERIKAELLLFLREQVINDEAAVVMEMFSSIEKVGECIGGALPFTLLLPLLEDGLQFEEEPVRKRVVEKYSEVVERCELPKCENQVMASLKRIFANDFEEVKEAFCCVAARKLGHFSAPNQQELLGMYGSLVEDGKCLPRRKYAAKYCKDLMRWLQVGEGAILKILEVLSKDKEESNKIFLVDAIIQLSRVKSPATLQSYFNIISYQFSWRIRYQLISKVEQLAAAMGKEQFKVFLPYYTKYLNDIEPEIRSIANRKLQDLLPFLEPEDLVARILPVLKNIPQDTHAYVRNSLADSLLHLCAALGKKNTIEHVLPKFLTFLKDEQEPQIKQTIFGKVGLICETLGIETLSQSLMPVLDEMVASPNWRTRCQSIKILSYLVANSPVAFMTEKVQKVVTDYLRDRANAVRREGVQLLVRIIEQHGQAWAEKNLIPKLLPMFKAQTFVQRETILLALEPLIPLLSPDCLSRHFFANVFYLVQDPVENVRMSVCVALGALYPHIPKEKDSIKKLLKTLREDKDNDVKDLAAKIFSKLP